MKRWVQKLRQTFARAGREATPAAASAPLSDIPAPPPAPPQSTDDVYAVFDARVAPLLAALKSLPPDKNGLEFFIRSDILRPGDYPERPDIPPQINVWLFHTREAKPAGKLHDAPTSHLISIESKRSTPEWQDFSQQLALSETPVLRLSFSPDAEGADRLTRHTYIESYETPQAGKTYSIYCGSYGMVIDKSAETSLARAEDFVSEIESWLKTHAPARLAEVTRLLSPPRDIDILPPINIRKRGPSS
ncbi:MAG: hypothetical protein Q8K65_02895 [Alphaproteobacteria bacterium]|nr:hypothetical protein [Alphaproteobacteria bacterium]